MIDHVSTSSGIPYLTPLRRLPIRGRIKSDFRVPYLVTERIFSLYLSAINTSVLLTFVATNTVGVETLKLRARPGKTKGSVIKTQMHDGASTCVLRKYTFFLKGEIVWEIGERCPTDMHMLASWASSIRTCDSWRVQWPYIARLGTPRIEHCRTFALDNNLRRKMPFDHPHRHHGSMKGRICTKYTA